MTVSCHVPRPSSSHATLLLQPPSLTHPPTHPLTHSLTHPPTHSLTHPPTHPLTNPLTPILSPSSKHIPQDLSSAVACVWRVLHVSTLHENILQAGSSCRGNSCHRSCCTNTWNTANLLCAGVLAGQRMVCCVALPCCLLDIACFFLPSFSTHVYLFVRAMVYVCT